MAQYSKKTVSKMTQKHSGKRKIISLERLKSYTKMHAHKPLFGCWEKWGIKRSEIFYILMLNNRIEKVLAQNNWYSLILGTSDN